MIFRSESSSRSRKCKSVCLCLTKKISNFKISQDSNTKWYTFNSYSPLWTCARLRVTAARDGHLLSLRWSPTNQKMVTHQKEVCYRLRIWHVDLYKQLWPGDNCQEWAPTILSIVTHLSEDGHPPEVSMLQIRNDDKLTTARNGHLPSLAWSPTNPRMITLRKDVYYRLRIWHLDLTHKMKTMGQLPGMVTYHLGDGPPPTQAWSPTIRMYTTHSEFMTKT